MSFTYNFDAAPQISTVRLLVGDTVDENHIWEDAEVNAALQFESSQGAGVMMALSGYQRVAPLVYSYRRAAAMLLDGLASHRTRLGGALKVLDISVDLTKAGEALRDQAKTLRETEASSGSFAVAEMVQDAFSARERFWKQNLRIYG